MRQSQAGSRHRILDSEVIILPEPGAAACMSQARVEGLSIGSWLVLQFPYSSQHRLWLLVISV